MSHTDYSRSRPDGRSCPGRLETATPARIVGRGFAKRIVAWFRRSTQERRDEQRRRSGLQRLRASTPLPDLVDPDTGWFRSWYFLLRLEEELVTASRQNREAFLVLVRLSADCVEPDGRLRLDVRLRLGMIEEEATLDRGFFGRLSTDEVAVFIGHHDVSSSRTCLATIEEGMATLPVTLGIATSPRDGRDRGALLTAATRRLQRAGAGADSPERDTTSGNE